jgi:hypothetical protein
VLGGSHTWPGAARSASPLYTTETISATNLALAFFADHRATPSPSARHDRSRTAMGPMRPELRRGAHLTLGQIPAAPGLNPY